MFSHAREIGHPCGRAIRLLLWHGVFFPNIHRRSTADHCPVPPSSPSRSPARPHAASDHDSGPVMVTTSGSMVRLFFAESNTFAALFEAPVLAKLVRHSGVTLEATLPKPDSDIKKKIAKNILGKYSMALPATAHIIVYGKRAAMYEVGAALWDEDLHLQHPSVEIEPNVEYFNPQYLLAPGETFPQPVAAAAVSRTHGGPLDEVVTAESGL